MRRYSPFVPPLTCPRVHEFNTECLVLTYLPYHATPQFLAMLSILPPSPPQALRFLFPYITPPTNPPRHAIVYTATNTPAFFTALQGYVVKALQAGHAGSSLVSFWSGVTAQAVDAILEQSQSGRQEVKDQRTEEALLRVLPALNECLKMVQVPEALLGSYMITIILVTKGGFQDKVLDALLEGVIRSQTPEVLESCFMCAAVMAEERTRTRFPGAVSRRLLKVPNLASTLQSLATKCRVDRLALGTAMGALDSIKRPESAGIFQDIVTSGVLSDSYTSIALSAMLQLVKEAPLGSAEHGELVNLANKLSEESRISRLLQTLIKDNDTDFESLGLNLQITDVKQIEPAQSEDEEMMDVDAAATEDTTPVTPPKVTVSSFLEENSTENFKATLEAFEQTASSTSRASAFLSSSELGQQDATKKPLFFSFLARTWCSSASVSAKVAALRSASSALKKLHGSADFQHVIPYLISALTDPAPSVRRAAASCISTLSAKSDAKDVWASTTLYGKSSSKLTPLPKGQTSSVLTTIFVPILEECVMDPKFVITSLRNQLEGSQNKALKSATKTALVSFLASHISATPLLRVRLSLLPAFDFLGKITNTARVSNLLPVVRAWASLSAADVASNAKSEDVAPSDADKGFLAVLAAREAESVELLKELLSGDINKDRPEFVEAAFERLVALWPSMKTESRLSLSHTLLELAMQQDCATRTEEAARARALDTLRNVKLDTAVLLDLVESVPAALQMPEGPPAKKRRRTSRSEMARLDVQSADDVSKLLRRLTTVLELVEGSNPAEHAQLFKNLFAILGDLQPLKQQSGSDLVYIQSLILGSLTPMVNVIKDRSDASEYQTSARADLLIDIVRHSGSPQVQNAALLLIASLATWVPEVVLHNIMPIFTFISSTLLRQNDDYSAHVVDQTISRVVPQLAASLRAKHKNLLTGVSDLLLSFTAAFEHIPHHRRMKLFSELARTLGPADSLSAIVALLIHSYPASTAQKKFVPDLLLQFEPMVTLHVSRFPSLDQLKTNSF